MAYLLITVMVHSNRVLYINASHLALRVQEAKRKLSDSAAGLHKESVFYQLSTFGLINFSDFLFLLTVLSVSRCVILFHVLTH